MSDIEFCARGCTSWGHHMPDCQHQDWHLPSCTDDTCDQCDPDWCAGCQPRQADEGHLCARCIDRLAELLDPPDNPESVAGVCAWLADNLGQHIRAAGAGSRSRSATPGEAFVTVMSALADLQISWAEYAQEFLADRGMSPLNDTDPAAISARLRPWRATLAAWDATVDTLDHLIELRAAAHGVCPWRGKSDPGDDIAAALYLAPAEETAVVCQMLGVTDVWLRQAKRRGKLTPDESGVKPLKWRPWDVFAVLHPQAATRYEARLAQTA